MFWDKVPLCYNCSFVFSVSSSVLGIESWIRGWRKSCSILTGTDLMAIGKLETLAVFSSLRCSQGGVWKVPYLGGCFCFGASSLRIKEVSELLQWTRQQVLLRLQALGNQLLLCSSVAEAAEAQICCLQAKEWVWVSVLQQLLLSTEKWIPYPFLHVVKPILIQLFKNSKYILHAD